MLGCDERPNALLRPNASRKRDALLRQDAWLRPDDQDVKHIYDEIKKKRETRDKRHDTMYI